VVRCKTLINPNPTRGGVQRQGKCVVTPSLTTKSATAGGSAAGEVTTEGSFKKCFKSINRDQLWHQPVPVESWFAHKSHCAQTSTHQKVTRYHVRPPHDHLPPLLMVTLPLDLTPILKQVSVTLWCTHENAPSFVISITFHCAWCSDISLGWANLIVCP